MAKKAKAKPVKSRTRPRRARKAPSSTRRALRESFGFGRNAPVPISLAVRAGDYVFVSGLADHFFRPEECTFDEHGELISDGSGGGLGTIEEQTHCTLNKIKEVLARADCTMDDIVDMIVWLREPKDFVGFNETYKEFFTSGKPARAVLRNAMMFTTRIEIKVIAYKPLP
jgi:enamine deaminase RidA (YjgF/YER057c/UK114 family)